LPQDERAGDRPRGAVRRRARGSRGGRGPRAERPGDHGEREAHHGGTHVAATRPVSGSEHRAVVDACREAPLGGTAPGRRLAAAVGAASLAAVYLEVSLMKLVSVMYYSIFVYAVIAVALLGVGAAGTLLALAAPPSPDTALRRMARCCVGFSAAVLPTFLAV